jgi:GH15 family glucan-1,4-alpha-glucosidase
VVAVAHLHGQVLGLPDRERLGLRRVDASLWLVDNLALAGQTDRATALFERLLGQANDLGQLAEEIDPASGELLGNFPKAFSHVGLISAATNLQRGRRTYRAASG